MARAKASEPVAGDVKQQALSTMESDLHAQNIKKLMASVRTVRSKACSLSLPRGLDSDVMDEASKIIRRLERAIDDIENPKDDSPDQFVEKDDEVGPGVDPLSA
jgi:hypothetical protein